MDNQSTLTPKTRLTPIDFFLYLGFVLGLIISVVSFINLSFDGIERLLPDPLNKYHVQTSSMQSAIAFLLISFPATAILARFIRKTINKTPEKANLALRKWVIYAVLFISSLIALGDIITLIKYFLMGDLGSVFISKVLIVLLVSVILFVYFIHQLTYDNAWSKKSVKVFEYVSIAIFVMAIVFGFVTMGSPAMQRKIRFDDQRLSDMQSIQWQVINYYQQYGKLPKNLAETVDPLSSYMVPPDPEGFSYDYKLNDNTKLSFALCATFSLSTDESNKYKESYNGGNYYSEAKLGDSVAISSRPYTPDATFDNWAHNAGYSCFDRVIDPVRYPLYKNN